METQITAKELEKLEREIKEFEKEIERTKEIGRLARLIVSGKLEKNLSAKKRLGRKKICHRQILR